MILDNVFKVEGDGNQWVLTSTENKGLNKDTGKPIISTSSYYHTTLGSALASYIDKKLTKAETVEDAILKLKELLEQVKQLKGKNEEFIK